jgi:hypothetical protein
VEDHVVVEALLREIDEVLLAFGASVVKRSISMSPFSVEMVALVMAVLLWLLDGTVGRRWRAAGEAAGEPLAGGAPTVTVFIATGFAGCSWRRPAA